MKLVVNFPLYVATFPQLLDIEYVSSFPPAISTCWLHKKNSYQSPRQLSRTYQQSAGVITKFS